MSELTFSVYSLCRTAGIGRPLFLRCPAEVFQGNFQLAVTAGLVDFPERQRSFSGAGRGISERLNDPLCWGVGGEQFARPPPDPAAVDAAAVPALDLGGMNRASRRHCAACPSVITDGPGTHRRWSAPRSTRATSTSSPLMRIATSRPARTGIAQDAQDGGLTATDLGRSREASAAGITTWGWRGVFGHRGTGVAGMDC